jgi:hypothetical protein
VKGFEKAVVAKSFTVNLEYSHPTWGPCTGSGVRVLQLTELQNGNDTSPYLTGMLKNWGVSSVTYSAGGQYV